MKKLIMLIVFSLLFTFSPLVPTAGAETNPSGKGKETIPVNIMSYNIHHGVGTDSQLDLGRIANVIKENGAEIIGLQEVDKHYGARSNFEDQTKKIAKLLGYNHYVYGANLNLEPNSGDTKRREYGTAIISKYPIIKSRNTFLTSVGEQRGLLHATVNVKGYHVQVYNIHLGLDEASRTTQIEEIITESNKFEGPSVLMGDFNTTPETAEIQKLLTGSKFIDSFSGIEAPYTFPVPNPIKQIDYIFTSDFINIANQRVLFTEASDHLPIITTIELSKVKTVSYQGTVFYLFWMI